MPTHAGPNIAAESSIIFSYDVGDTSNSYRGEPAVNLITSGLPGYFGSGGQTLYQDRLLGLKSDSGVFQYNYVTNPALTDSSTYNNNAGLYKNFNTATLNPNTEYIQISFDFYMIVPYVRINNSGTGLNGYLGVRSTDLTIDNYQWNTTYSNGTGDDWNNNNAYVGKWQKVSLIVDIRDDKVPQDITSMYIYNDRTLQGAGIFTNFIITEHTTFPTGPVRYTSSTRSATQGLVPLVGNSTMDLSNVSFNSDAQMIFDGTDDYIESTTNLTSLQDLTSGTIETIFKWNGSTSYTVLLHLFAGSSYYGTTLGLGDWTGAYANDSILFMVQNASGTELTTAAYYRNGSTTYRDNLYHHLVVTGNGSQLQMYLDGNLLNLTSTSTTKFTPPTVTKLQIGKRDYGSGTGFHSGEIPITKIYNVALSADQVKQNYKQYKSRFNLS
jgi:hypothetical protein